MSTLNSVGYHLLKLAAEVGSDCYPETLGVYLIVNAPAFFPFVWAVIKAFLDEKTRRSVRVTTPADQLETLREFINDEDIPSFLGGKCTCESYGGCMKSDKGPWQQFERVRPRWVRRKEICEAADWEHTLEELCNFKNPYIFNRSS